MAGVAEARGLCRGCRARARPLRALFRGSAPLARDYRAVTGLPAAQGDGRPPALCRACVRLLALASRFIRRCRDSEASFAAMFSQPQPIKQELELQDDADIKLEGSDASQDADPSTLYTSTIDIKSELDNDLSNEPSEYAPEPDDQPQPNEKSPQHACEICQKSFTKRSGLNRHMANHNSETKPFECTECFRRFKREDLLIRHATVHVTGFGVNVDYSKEEDANEKYACDRCPMEFSTKNGQSSHMKIHKSEDGVDDSRKDYQCHECGKSFLVRGHLTRHAKIHMKIKQYKCTQCAKEYSRQDQLLSHMNKHNGIKPNVCPFCNKGFAQICNLKDHLRIHTGETPFLCSICGKAFNSGSNLRQHVNRHKGITPFICSLCPKKFISKGELTCHISSHTGAHPYVCDTCGHSFTKPNSLKKHMRIHSGIKPFECDVCRMSFAYKDLLKRHYRIHTGEKPYKCNFCDRSFIQSNDLVKHTRSHVGDNIYECKICGMKFRLQSDLKNHYPSHYVKTDNNLDDTKLNQNSTAMESEITITKVEIGIENDVVME